MRAFAFAALAACSAAPEPAPAPEEPAPPLDARAAASARYLLRFAGAPVGHAELSLRPVAGGYRLRRHDAFTVRRDGVRLESQTSLRIDTDGALRARRVHLSARVGRLHREVTASRDAGGWTIARSGGERSRLGAELEVADVAALALETADGVPVLLPGASFARLEMAVRPSEGGRELTLSSAAGSITTRIELAGDGLPEAWRSDTGESAERIRGLAPVFEPAELLDLAAMPGGGRRSGRLRIRGARRPAPVEVAGQRVSERGGEWLIELSSPPRIPIELAALTREVGEMLTDDLALPGLAGSEALRMGRGDCTGHAAALAVLAQRRGYRARLATGYRRHGRRWLRHRWTVVELDGQWVSLDPSFGEAPPPRGRLLALSVHGDGDDEIAIADLVTFRGMAGATARFE